MAKSKRRKHNKASGSGHIAHGGHYGGSRRRRDYAITAAVVIAVIIVVAGFWWMSSSAKKEFLALAMQGEAALAGVRREPSLGRTHLRLGETQTYTSRFPLSGPHHPVPTEPGFYDFTQPPIQLVHALEHGHIVIYYDEPGADALETLKQWADLYGGPWDGIVLTKMPRLGERIELTAWTRQLGLRTFDAATAAAFIDAYRGRGPEHPVR
jgi:hypothetical protein